MKDNSISDNFDISGNFEDDEEVHSPLEENVERYTVEKNNDDIEIITTKKKRIKVHPLLIISIIICLLILVFFIKVTVMQVNYQSNYKETDEKTKTENKKPLDDCEYTNIVFENGFEVMMIKNEEAQTSMGNLIFSKGYIDYNFNGTLNIAMKILENFLLNENNETDTILDNYFGKRSYFIDGYYSGFTFEILNDGLFKFLKIFLNIMNYDENKINKNITLDAINKVSRNCTMNRKRDENYNEKHLIEYLLYNVTDSEGNEYDSNCYYYSKQNIEDLIPEIKEILREITNPKNVKFILYSHYKLSQQKHHIIKYLQYFLNKNETNDNNTYNIYKKEINVKKQQFIYHSIDEYQKEYISFIFYIDKIEGQTPSDLYIKYHYFNYIKDILEERSENSLYDQLNKNFQIKDIFVYMTDELNKYIKFTLKIELNLRSYHNIEDIIIITYNYIDYITNNEIQNQRYKDLSLIYKQKFNFEINHNIKELGLKMFKLDSNFSYYFYDDFLPTFNESEILYYFKQLTIENSNIILGLIKDEGQKQINCSDLIYENVFLESCQLSKNPKKNLKYYYNNDFGKLDKYDYTKLKISFDIIINYSEINKLTPNITYRINPYISNYIDLIEPNQNYVKTPENKIRNNNNVSVLYFVYESSYRVPKIHFDISLYHPYFRLSIPTKKFNYYSMTMFLVLLERKIKEKFSDAIRAGNTFEIGTSENYPFISFMTFSDVSTKIFNETLDLLYQGWFNENSEFIKDSDVYRNLSCKYYFNYRKSSDSVKFKYFLFSDIKNDFVNKFQDLDCYDFREDDNLTDLIEVISKNRVAFYKTILAVGFLSNNILDELWGKLENINKYEETDFKYLLTMTNYRNFTPELFKDNCLKVNLIKGDQVYHSKINLFTSRKYGYRKYIHFGEFTIENYAKSILIRNLKIKPKFNDNSTKYICNENKFYTIRLEESIINGTYLAAYMETDENLDFDVLEKCFREGLDKYYDELEGYSSEKVDKLGNRLDYLKRSAKEIINNKKSDLDAFSDYVRENIFFTNDIQEDFKTEYIDALEGIKSIEDIFGKKEEFIDMFYKNKYLEVYTHPFNLGN